jgi:hypothetical protein
LIQNKGVLKPVHCSGIKGGRIPHAKRNTVCGEAVDRTSAIAQGIHHKLEHEIEGWIFTCGDLSLEILVCCITREKLVQLGTDRGVGAVKEIRAVDCVCRGQRGKQTSPLQEIPPEAGGIW